MQNWPDTLICYNQGTVCQYLALHREEEWQRVGCKEQKQVKYGGNGILGYFEFNFKSAQGATEVRWEAV